MALNYGVKITEAGYGVATATIENIAFSSAYPFFKVYSDSSSGLNLALNATSGSITFSHSLGYVPAFMLYSTAFTGDSYGRMMPRGKSPDPIFATGYSTSSNVIFLIKLAGAQPAFSITVRCVIFVDRIS